jgi:ABC-type thiamin/hydroxymethylpyrimidine transport system permease subunit
MLSMKVLAVVFGVSGVCWLFPDAIGVFLFHALQVSPRESMVIGALFFAGAAILLFIESPDDKRL